MPPFYHTSPKPVRSWSSTKPSGPCPPDRRNTRADRSRRYTETEAMYSARAVMLRRCVGVRTDGLPCQAWALWDDPQQRCIRHSGCWRPTWGRPWRESRVRAAYEPCRCDAYAWPHRPGGGLCRWPEQPDYALTTPAGTHRYPRLRVPRWFRESFSGRMINPRRK